MPGVTSSLEDTVAKSCFMPKPDQNQKPNIKNQNDRSKCKESVICLASISDSCLVSLHFSSAFSFLAL
jgi:hypothetical protein